MANIKARFDVTRCFVCKLKFSDDVRMDIIQESTLIGTVHESCYENLFGGFFDAPSRMADASQDREAG